MRVMSSTGALIAHLWQTTIFLGLTAVLAWCLRRNEARVRYWIWTAASLKFVVPFALIASLGHRLSWVALPSAAVSVTSFAMGSSDSRAFVTNADFSSLRMIIPSAWALGVLVL